MSIQNVCKAESFEGKELIVYLSNLFGPTGCEDRVSAAIKPILDKYCDKTVLDRMGNLIGKISLGSSEKRKKIMLSAHLDEVGFMIDEISERGMLGFDTVGGIDPSVLAGKSVLVGNEKNLIKGVICSKAIHHKSKSERNEATDIDNLYIDIGVSSKEDAEKLISIGDFGTFSPTDNDSVFFGKDGNTLKCKALDDRMGCAALIEIMRELEVTPPSADVDVCFCFTVREEIGLSGAKAAAYELRPDYAIVLETTAVADIADTPDSRRVADVRGGAVISVMDRSTVYCRELVDTAMRVAQKKGIKAQRTG